MANSEDPTVIDTVVVAATDLVAALETNHRSPQAETVLRATPPFSGRMRARLHVERGSDPGERATVRFPPESLVEETCPAPPEADAVEDALRADPSVDYTVDRHRERYRAALREWRTSVPTAVVEDVESPVTDGRITVAILGTVPEE